MCLVDDTATTGQTMAEAAATLKAAGAEHVAALAYTRTQDVSGGGELVDEALGVNEIAEAMAAYGFAVAEIASGGITAWRGTRHPRADCTSHALPRAWPRSKTDRNVRTELVASYPGKE